MENQNNNSSLKIVILVLLLLLLGSVYYNIKLSSEASALITEVKSVKTEKK